MLPRKPFGFVEDLIENGLELLRVGLSQFPEVDPSKTYEEKNHYFHHANGLGYSFITTPGLQWVAELYYQAMLDAILSYERDSGRCVNKGMVFANLGIAQIRNGRVDEGVANFLTAEQEDKRDFSLENWDILNISLWHQFEYLVTQIVLYLTQKTGETLAFTADEAYVSSLFQGMDRQDRIFLEGTLLSLYNNFSLFKTLEQTKNQANAYTRGRLYSGLKDLCLLTESLLRKKQIADSIITATARAELPDLLDNVLPTQPIGYPQKLPSGANNLPDFLKHLEMITQKARCAELRWIYCVHLVRNFTGHHFDPSETIRSPNGKTFFDLYEDLLTNVLLAILYFRQIDAI